MHTNILKNSKTSPLQKSNKKILLYFPTPFPYHRPWKGVPLALLAISRTLAKEGYDIKIFTHFLSKNVEKEIIKNGNNAICLGISAMTGFQIYDGLKITKKFKKKYPNIPIVWGGWHPSILPLETLKNPYVDIVVRGQGDVTFTKLVKALETKKTLKSVLGISYKKSKKYFHNPDRPPVNLDSLPPLPYHLIDVNKCVFGTEYGEKTIPYISSYGCPHRCGFCVEQIVNKRRWTSLSSKNVVDEWESLIKKYKADSIAVYDSNFFVNEKRTAEICQMLLDRKLNIKWGNANGRVGQLSRYQPKTWELMEKSGCAMILTGAESGSQDALDLIEKDMDVNEIIKFTKLCHKYHIKILYSFLVGLPWSKNPIENKKFVDSEYKSTLSLINQTLKISNRNRYTYYIFLPYPGAPLFHRAVSLGLNYPKSLKNWSTYLMSPEDAFKTVTRQKWITSYQARLTAMLTQYIFGLMDRDTYDVLIKRISNPIYKILFIISFNIGLSIVKLRWKFKFFRYPVDYLIFTYVHKHGGLI